MSSFAGWAADFEGGLLSVRQSSSSLARLVSQIVDSLWENLGGKLEEWDAALAFLDGT